MQFDHRQKEEQGGLANPPPKNADKKTGAGEYIYFRVGDMRRATFGWQQGHVHVQGLCKPCWANLMGCVCVQLSALRWVGVGSSREEALLGWGWMNYLNTT